MSEQLIKNISIYGAADFVGRIIAIAVFPIYTHYFTVEEYGLITLLVTLLNIIAAIANPGVNSAVQRFYLDKNTDQNSLVSTGLWLMIGWSLGTTLLVLGALGIWGNMLKDLLGVQMFLILVVVTSVLPGQITVFAQDLMRIKFRPTMYMVLSLARNLLVVFIVLSLVVGGGMGVKGYFIGMLSGFSFAAFIAIVTIRYDISFRFSGKYLGKILRYGLPFIFVSLGSWIFQATDRWMLVNLSTTTELGYYGVAAQITTVVTFVNIAFSQAWSPYILKCYANDDRCAETSAEVLVVLFFVLFVIAAGIALFGRELLMFLTPEVYWPAANIIVFLVMGIVVFGTTQITALGISFKQKTQFFVVANWLTAIFNIGLNWFLIPLFGGMGAAFATIVSFTLLTLMYGYCSHRLYSTPYKYENIMFVILLIVFVTLLSLYLNSLEWGIGQLAIKTIILFGCVGLGLVMNLVPPRYLQKLFELARRQ